MNYYISDLHIGCHNKYEGRTLEHDTVLKTNWNNTVTNGDTVYICGDIGREGGNRDTEYLCEIISTLKGRKVLIQGNHEKLNDIRVKQLFTEIVPYKEVADNAGGVNHMLVLSHYPILMWKNQHKGWIHLYGHVHATDEWKVYKDSLIYLNEYFKDKTLKGYKDCPPAVAFNVGCMLWNYTPVTLNQLMNGFEKEV